MTLVKPQLMLLDFNRESRHLGEHFACHPHLILERHRRGDRRGTVKVPTVLQVTRLLRGRVRLPRKQPQAPIQAQSQTAPPTQGSTGSSERRVSRQPTQFPSVLLIRMTEKSARWRHSYRQNKG